MSQENKCVSIFDGVQIEEQISEDMALLSNGQITIDGYAVPFLIIRAVQAENGVKTYHITLDNRFGYFAEGKEELHSNIKLAADSMAVARGYSSFGKNLRPMNEFNNTPIGLLSFFNKQG